MRYEHWTLWLLLQWQNSNNPWFLFALLQDEELFLTPISSPAYSSDGTLHVSYFQKHHWSAKSAFIPLMPLSFNGETLK